MPPRCHSPATKKPSLSEDLFVAAVAILFCFTV